MIALEWRFDAGRKKSIGMGKTSDSLLCLLLSQVQRQGRDIMLGVLKFLAVRNKNTKLNLWGNKSMQDSLG